jgi:MYXO-CTERM domain-containing protein
VQREHAGGAVTIELRYDELPDKGGSEADGTAGEGGTAATSADEGVGSVTAASSGADGDSDGEGAGNEEGGDDGCGCATDPPPRVTLWSVLGVLALRRRQRRSHE